MTGATTTTRGGARRDAVAGLPAWVLVFGVVVAVLAIAIAVGMPLLDGSDSVLGRLTVVCFAIGMTALVLTGCALLQRDLRHPMGWILVAAGIAGLLSRLIAGALVAIVQSGVELPAATLWLVNWAWVPAQFMLFELLLRFPSGRLPARGWRVVEVVGIAWAVVAFIVVAFVPGPLGAEPLEHVQNPFGFDAASDALTGALGPVFLVGNALIVVGCGAPLWRWVREGSGSEERQQLRWVLAAVVFLAFAVPAAAIGGALELAEAAAALALPATIAVAVHREGLWDLGKAVRRSLVYSTATAVLAAGYLIFVLSWDADAAPLLAALLVAAVALPVRNAVHWLLDRVLYGTRGDPDAAVAELAEGLRRASESPATTIVRVVADTLRVPRVAIEDAGGRTLAEARWPAGSAVSAMTDSLPPGRGGPTAAGAARIELTAHGAHAGWLVAEERAPGEGLGEQDRRLLDRVAPHAGLVVRAHELTARLRSSYANLVSVREDERARLQRELHDGLGPALASVVMQSEAARNLAHHVARDTADGSDRDAAHRLDAVLEDIGRHAEAMVGDIRRIIEELRPISLQTQGLNVAVTDAVARIAPGLDATIDVPPGDLGLSSEAELAVYRIITEAVRNAFRHAQAEVLGVRVAADTSTVTVVVEDDGVGIADAPAGVGLTSMRERVEALGGSFTIGAHSGTADQRRGTIVRATIPKGGT